MDSLVSSALLLVNIALTLYAWWMQYQRRRLHELVHELVDGYNYVPGEAHQIASELLRMAWQRQEPTPTAFIEVLLASQAFRVAVVHEELQHRVYDAGKLPIKKYDCAACAGWEPGAPCCRQKARR